MVESKKDVDTDEKVVDRSGEEASKTTPLEPPSPEMCEKASKGCIDAMYRLALYARDFDLHCSLKLCEMAIYIYTAILRYDRSRVDPIWQDEVFLLYLLTNPSVSRKDLIANLKQLSRCPLEVIAENARQVLREDVCPPTTIVERLAHWWRRPWGKWQTLPIPSNASLDEQDKDLVPVLELVDIRPWRGRYLFCLTSKICRESGTLEPFGLRITPQGQFVLPNPEEERFLLQARREMAGVIEANAADMFDRAILSSDDWTPYLEGWKVVRLTGELLDDPEALIEANPLPWECGMQSESVPDEGGASDAKGEMMGEPLPCGLVAGCDVETVCWLVSTASRVSLGDIKRDELWRKYVLRAIEMQRCSLDRMCALLEEDLSSEDDLKIVDLYRISVFVRAMFFRLVSGGGQDLLEGGDLGDELVAALPTMDERIPLSSGTLFEDVCSMVSLSEAVKRLVGLEEGHRSGKREGEDGGWTDVLHSFEQGKERDFKRLREADDAYELRLATAFLPGDAVTAVVSEDRRIELSDEMLPQRSDGEFVFLQGHNEEGESSDIMLMPVEAMIQTAIRSTLFDPPPPLGLAERAKLEKRLELPSFSDLQPGDEVKLLPMGSFVDIVRQSDCDSVDLGVLFD